MILQAFLKFSIYIDKKVFFQKIAWLVLHVCESVAWRFFWYFH
jgi:hypothetical protein